jgi:hypothetical protein
MRLNLLETPANQVKDRGHESRCPFRHEPNQSLKHIMAKCQHHVAMMIMEGHNQIGSAVFRAIKEGTAHVEVWEDKRVNHYLRMFAHRTGVTRPDLMYEPEFVKRGKKMKVASCAKSRARAPG